MTIRGQIKDGELVLEHPVGLPDGLDVEVEVRPLPPLIESGPTWGEVFAGLAGSLDGLPSDLAENHDHYIRGAEKRSQSQGNCV